MLTARQALLVADSECETPRYRTPRLQFSERFSVGHMSYGIQEKLIVLKPRGIEIFVFEHLDEPTSSSWLCPALFPQFNLRPALCILGQRA